MSRTSKLTTIVMAGCFAVSFAVAGGIGHPSGSSAVPRAISTDPGSKQREVEGVLSVVWERWDDASRLVYVLDTDGGALTLHFAASQSPSVGSGSRIRVKGVRLGQDFYVESSSAGVETLSAAAPSAPAGQRTAILLLNFENKPADRPYPVEEARDAVWQSGEVFGWYTIPFDSRLCTQGSVESIGRMARAAAGSAGVNLSRYGTLVYVLPESSCDFESAGTVGGDLAEAWIRAQDLTTDSVARAIAPSSVPVAKADAAAADSSRLPNNVPSPDSTTVATVPTIQFASSVSGGMESQAAASLPVVLSAPSTQPVSVSYTFGGTAQTGTDYVAQNGTLTFNPGETTKSISASIVNNTIAEPTKTMLVTLSSPTNATLGTITTNTYYIFDNDAAPVATPTASFVTVSSLGLESTAPGNLWIVLSGPSTQTVSVSYKITGGSAGPMDYTMPAGPLVFAPGETAKPIALAVIDDNLYEPANEDMSVILQVVTNGLVGQPAGYTYTIVDNDGPPVIQFPQATGSGSETTTPANIQVSTSSSLNGYSFSVDYAVTGGTATAGTDYTMTSGTLTFFPRDTTKTIALPIIDDTVADGNKTVVLTLSNPTNGGSTVPVTVGSVGTYTYTIVDNEGGSTLPTVQFGSTSASGSESVTPASLPVVLSAASTQTVTVAYAVTGGTATGNGVDYTLANGTLTFSPGETSKSISIAIVNDTLVEPNETIAVTLSAPAGATLGANATSTYTIIDNDTLPTVQFSTTSASGSESVTPANLAVALSAASTQTVTVNYAVTGGTATGNGVDYTLANGTLTFSPGETSKSISIAIVNDTLVEPNETIAVTLSAPANATLGANTTSTYTIVDNDTLPTVQFNGVNFSGPESTSSVGLPVVLSAAYASAVTVNYAVTGGTATGNGVDYTLASGTLTFNAGETSKAVNIAIVNDTLVEPNETIVITLSAPSNATLGANATATYTINDNDTLPTVQFSAAASGASESVTSASLPVILSATYPQAVTVNYAVTGGTATGGGVDYTLANGTLTFNPGDSTKFINFTIVDDTLVEPNETIVITLSAPTNATLGTNATSTYTITDNDVAPLPTVNFTFTTSSGSESLTSVGLPVTLSAASTQTVTVNYAVTGATATSGVDFILPSGTLTFAPGETQKSISATIVDDSIVEPNENFVVTLSAPVGATLGTNTSETYVILDNDAAPLPTVQFGASALSGSEVVTPASLPVTLSAASTQTIAVNYAVTGGTATGGGVDYTLASGTLTFNPGETNKSINASIVNDTIFEPNETFIVTLSSPVGATLGAPQSCTFTILDDDNPADTTGPTMALTSPANGATVSNKVNLSASASDPSGVTRVEFYVNGSLTGTDTTAPYSVSWNSRAFRGQSVTIMAKGYDARGNTTTVSITVRVQ